MKVTEYIVEVHDTATGERSVWIAPNLEDLRRWLEDSTVIGEQNVVEHVLREISSKGYVEYDSDDVYDDPQNYGLTEDEVSDSDLPQMRIKVDERQLKVSDAEGVLRALHKINGRRARRGQPLLDPIESNWSVGDVFKEAERLG